MLGGGIVYFESGQSPCRAVQTPASAERQQHCCRLSDRSPRGRGWFQQKVCLTARKQLQKNLSKLELHTTFPITAGKITGISHLRLQSRSQYHHSPHLQTCIPAGWHHWASIHTLQNKPRAHAHTDLCILTGCTSRDFQRRKAKPFFLPKTSAMNTLHCRFPDYIMYFIRPGQNRSSALGVLLQHLPSVGGNVVSYCTGKRLWS